MVEFETTIIQFLTELSHHPYLLLSGITLILFLSSFGLPLPEELVLVSSGAIANLALVESSKSGLAPTLNPWLLSIVCFAAVFVSDSVVFLLGRKYGKSLWKVKPFNYFLNDKTIAHVEKWTDKYGAFACFIFRFTPGVRFPGHFMCGAMKISYQKFVLTDGVAALLTVPTQVLWIAFYGDEMLVYIKQFKIIFFSLLGTGLIFWLMLRIKSKYIDKKLKSQNSKDTAA